MQTVSSQFRVSEVFLNILWKGFMLWLYFHIGEDLSLIKKSVTMLYNNLTGELGQADDQLEEHPPSFCALSDPQWVEDSRYNILFHGLFLLSHYYFKHSNNSIT